MYQDPKICPHCHAKEITSFSTCRFCGTRYDATIPKKNISNIDRQVIISALAIILLIATILCYQQVQKSARLERLLPIRENIKAANKPRLIWLYCISTNNCDGGKRLLALYNTINKMIDERQVEYGEKIDFQKLNVEDKSKQKYLTMLSEEKLGPIQILTCPVILLFNRRGDEVVELRGEQLKGTNITSAEAQLDKCLQDPELFK